MPFLVPSSPRIRRFLRLAAWNALFIIIALALVALGGEAYFRVTRPFMAQSHPREFVPGVGYLYTPNAAMQSTNRLDYWTVSRTNSLGFRDREPPAPDPAAAGCPVAIIGDSFVEAREVPVADKFHLRLEQMAAAELPHLNLTTAAFGKWNTGQIDQLPYYDHYARHLRPRLLVLVFVNNDVYTNHPVLRSIQSGYDPLHLPWPSVMRRPDGTLALRPPDPEYRKFSLPSLPEPPRSWPDRALNEAGKVSWLAQWLRDKNARRFTSDYRQVARKARMELLSRRPQYAPLLEDPAILFWKTYEDIATKLARGGDLPAIYAEALEYTAFALGQFQKWAARDGAGLVILASHNMKVNGKSAMFDRIKEMAAAQGIPFIDQSDYILRQGAVLRDAQWRHDQHWNPQGHQWAAEALLEWIRENQQVCRPPPP